MKKSNNKKIIVLLITLAVSLVLVSTACGLGVTPAKLYLRQADENNPQTISLINNNHKALTVEVKIEGPLADYITITPSTIIFAPDDLEKQVTLSFVLPESLKNTPGIYGSTITFLEKMPSASKDNAVLAVVGVSMQVLVEIPSLGEHAKAKFFVKDISSGQVTFEVPIYNQGTQALPNVHAFITIYSPTKEKSDVISTETVTLDPGEEKTLYAVWDAKTSGSYEASAKVTYGSNHEILLLAPLSIGEPSLRFTQLEITGYKLGNIAKMNFGLVNEWNEAFDTTLSIDLLDTKGNEVFEFTSPPVKIGSQKEAMVEAFLDTRNLNEGIYILNATASYGGKASEALFTLHLEPETVSIYYGIESDPLLGKRLTPTLIIALLLVFGAVAIGIYWFMQKRRGSQHE